MARTAAIVIGEWFQGEKRIRVLSDSKAVGFAVCTVCAESTHLTRDRRKTPAPTPTSIAVPDHVKKHVAGSADGKGALGGCVFSDIFTQVGLCCFARKCFINSLLLRIWQGNEGVPRSGSGSGIEFCEKFCAFLTRIIKNKANSIESFLDLGAGESDQYSWMHGFLKGTAMFVIQRN
jgi:hypothetical protein